MPGSPVGASMARTPLLALPPLLLAGWKYGVSVLAFVLLWELSAVRASRRKPDEATNGSRGP